MSEKPSNRPNVIWIFGDQHRAQATGYAGDPNVHTPNLDRLATEGVNFRRAVAGAPWCTPFRGSLLTSRYPHNTTPETPSRLDPVHPTIADAFNEAGYDTAWIGKWHLCGASETKSRSAFHIVPREERGRFKKWIGYENNNSQFDCYIHGHEADGTEVALQKLPSYETDALTDLFLDHLQERANHDEPFFAALSVQPPHGPYTGPAEWMGHHTPGKVELRPNVPDIPRIREEASKELAGYYGMIENLDWNLGRIRTMLEDLGLTENTHIIFFSDHGDMLGSHGCSGKSQPWEESIRVPFIIGGTVPYYGTGWTDTDAVINHVDIAPTTLGLCGITPPDWMMGYDYSAYRLNPKHRPAADEPTTAYCQQCVRKYHNDGNDREWRAVVTRDGWKYAIIPGAPLGLYNLNEDPYEMCNQVFNPRFKDVRTRLQNELLQWIDCVDDAFVLPEL